MEVLSRYVYPQISKEKLMAKILSELNHHRTLNRNPYLVKLTTKEAAILGFSNNPDGGYQEVYGVPVFVTD